MKKMPAPKQKQSPNKLGAAGEQQALAFLQSQHYQILETNYKVKQWEIDIIALDLSADEIVFVEVKTRSSNSYGEPELAVNFNKMANLQIAGLVYLQQKNLENDFRFDIISILPDKIEHLKNITAEF